MERSDTTPDRIVVGIDGSDAAGEALRWAIDEADRRHATVEAVYAWHEALVSGRYHIVGDLRFYEQRAQRLLDAAIEAVDGADHVPVERKVVTGHAVSALLDEAKGAALLVVGSRGRGGFTGLLLGSVSAQVVQHAPCPVVIIPPAA